MVDVERTHTLQGVEPLRDIGFHEPRLAVVENRVSGEDDALLGYVHGNLSTRMTRRVQEVKRVVAHAQRYISLEDDRGLVGIAVVRFPIGKDRRALRVVG